MALIAAGKNQLLHGKPSSVSLTISATPRSIYDVLEAIYSSEVNNFSNLSDGDVCERDGGVVEKTYSLTLRTLDGFSVTQYLRQGTSITAFDITFDAKGDGSGTLSLVGDTGATGVVRSVSSGAGDRSEYTVEIDLFSDDGSTAPLTFVA